MPYHIVYPYNEILPKRKAHDLFLFQEAANLARNMRKVTLLTGRGSLSLKELSRFYRTDCPNGFELAYRPIVRKNNPFGISWNWPFFAACEAYFKKESPDLILYSVLGQAHFHLARKKSDRVCAQVYEAHELAYYPNARVDRDKLQMEREVFAIVDLIVVTTHKLASILRGPPYSFDKPIAVVPLASGVSPLEPSTGTTGPLKLAYVGQLYKEQGVELALEALQESSGVELLIVGGAQSDVERLKKRASDLNVESRTRFTGFQPQGHLNDILKGVDGFIAPFEAIGRMPYVAHTKFYDYARFGRAIIAPDLDIVREDLTGGTLFYKAHDKCDLARAMMALRENGLRANLEREVRTLGAEFTWQKRAQRLYTLFSGVIDAKKLI